MTEPLKMMIPKGRLQEKVQHLLERIGIEFSINPRSYRPVCSDSSIEIKLLKPQNIPSLVALGRHDCGFTGLDWIIEEKCDQDGRLVELIDLGYNKVRIVAAVPEALLSQNPDLTGRQLVVASEYPTLAGQYIARKNLNAILIKTFGATEALPPDDADMIVDNTSTGSTLQMNRLTIVDELLTSTTRFIASSQALADPWKKEKLDQIQMLMQSALNADRRVLLEMNVGQADLENLVANLPCMRSPTVSPLYGDSGFAVKVSVLSKDVPKLIPQLMSLGARDILEYRLEKIVQ